MRVRKQVLKALEALPPGVVRWASDPVIDPPRLPTGLTDLDRLFGGGWPRGRISVLVSKGHTTGGSSVLARTLAFATAAGGLGALVDVDDSLDPASLEAAGVDLDRVLWVRGPLTIAKGVRAAEEVLLAGGFEMVAVFGVRGQWQGGMWARLRRAVERSRAVLLVQMQEPWWVPGAFGVNLGPVTALWGGEKTRVLVGIQAKVTAGHRVAEIFVAEAWKAI